LSVWEPLVRQGRSLRAGLGHIKLLEITHKGIKEVTNLACGAISAQAVAVSADRSLVLIAFRVIIILTLLVERRDFNIER